MWRDDEQRIRWSSFGLRLRVRLREMPQSGGSDLTSEGQVMGVISDSEDACIPPLCDGRVLEEPLVDPERANSSCPLMKAESC